MVDISVEKTENTHYGKKLIDIHRISMHNGAMIDKELIAATSRALVLSILTEEDSYGYSIIQRVGELTKNEFVWTDSMLYPVLHRLEKQGSTKSYWKPSPTGRKRKYYTLTDSHLQIENAKLNRLALNQKEKQKWENLRLSF